MGELRGDLKFEITKEIGVISESTKGWRKELNYVSWNDRPPKLDIREWHESHDKMGKGVTLSAEEARVLFGLLGGIDLTEPEQ